MEDRILSKSQINTFLQCPFKWKRVHLDKIRSKPSYAQQRGIRIHSNIEKFYSKIEIKDNKIVPKATYKVPPKFLQFENKRLARCKNADKYFKPLFQELPLHSNKLKMRGFVDAVYINPKDDGLIIIDYKTGKYYPDNYDDYRFELAIYKMLIEDSDKIDVPIKYWGILFVDQDELFFEECKEEDIIKAKETIKQAREGMACGEYPPKLNIYCKYCQFKEECGILNNYI